MDDGMDKQKAADLLDNLLGMVEDSQENDYDTALKMGIEALNADVQPQRWIPVTPDSPPCYMPVLTWDGETRHVEQRIPYVRDESGEKIISDWWIDGDEKWDEWAEYQPNIRDGCAIKWMPLPQPPKEGDE